MMIDKAGGSLRHPGLRRLLCSKRFIAAATIMLLIVGCSLFAGLLSSHPRDYLNLSERNLPPSVEHWLGTDPNGRDVLARLLFAGRVSLTVACSALLITITVGLLVGLVSGYYGGVLDELLMRFVDALLSIPYFVFALALAAILPGGLLSAVFIIGLPSWPMLARLVRVEVLRLKKQPFVIAARAAGLGSRPIICNHLLPNITIPIAVQGGTVVARAILAEAALSYLGVGVQIPVPSWGNMLAESQDLISFGQRWWQWLPPGLLITLTTLAANMIADIIAESFEPRMTLKRDRL